MRNGRGKKFAFVVLCGLLLVRCAGMAMLARPKWAVQACGRKCSIAFVILTTTSQQNCRARAIEKTWGAGFTVYFVTSMSSEESPGTNYARFPGNDTYRNLKSKMKWFWLNYYDDLKAFDWVLKGDDDTFVRSWWLCQYLSVLNPAEPYYLGSNYGGTTRLALNAGGAGYILSKSTLTLLYECLATNNKLFEETHGSEEDVMTLRCLESGPHVKQLDLRDRNSLRISPFAFGDLKLPKWASVVIPRPSSERHRLSRSFLTFHRATVKDLCIFHQMYTVADQRRFCHGPSQRHSNQHPPLLSHSLHLAGSGRINCTFAAEIQCPQ